ncbi:hypothetical protein KUCAC02_016942 [Chaenocephalus aceratus]|nr:hypothetical protein KUCAC02_016942 [Chaenocephalus aceratus]
MLRIIPFLFLVLCGPVLGGPQTNFHGNMTDQELFWGTDQYDFSVVVPAAGLECFWHFAHRGERFYLSFMVQWVTGVGHDRHLSVTVNAPSSLIMATVDDAKGQINFETEETGFYQMCFSNFHNRFGTMQVFLSFGVYYDGYKDPDKTKEEEKKKERGGQQRPQQHTERHRGCDSQSGEPRLPHVPLLQLRPHEEEHGLLSAAVQLALLFLKRLFISKSGTEEKPRC